MLLIDFINVFIREGGPRLSVDAVRAARHAAALKRRLRRSRVPVIYANDHFGNWQSDFPSLVKYCGARNGCSAELVRLLAPQPEDYSVLKPRHSAFYGTPLEFLLEELGVRRLILAGIEADVCVMYTAHDAYMRKFSLWVPRNCTAARSTNRLNSALSFMKVNLKADLRPAGDRVHVRSVFGS